MGSMLKNIIETLFEDAAEAAQAEAQAFAGELAEILEVMRARLTAQGNDPGEVLQLARREAETIAAQHFARASVRARRILTNRAWAVLDLGVAFLTGFAAADTEGGTDDDAA